MALLKNFEKLLLTGFAAYTMGCGSGVPFSVIRDLESEIGSSKGSGSFFYTQRYNSSFYDKKIHQMISLHFEEEKK